MVVGCNIVVVVVGCNTVVVGFGGKVIAGGKVMMVGRKESRNGCPASLVRRLAVEDCWNSLRVADQEVEHS